jgi:hypothetical protein
MEFVIIKFCVMAVFKFFHGLIYTYVTGLPLEAEPHDK